MTWTFVYDRDDGLKRGLRNNPTVPQIKRKRGDRTPEEAAETEGRAYLSSDEGRRFTQVEVTIEDD